MSESPIEDFFAQYDDLAVAIVDDRRPNIHLGITMCNAEMADAICEIMNWEYFDLFEEHNFQAAYDGNHPLVVLAHCYLACLRWDLWTAATVQEVGDQEFNEKACADSHYWYLKLRDRYVALVNKQETKHGWLH